MGIIGPPPSAALLIANQALNGLEIEHRSNSHNYHALFAPSASGDWRMSSIFHLLDIVLVPVSHHFLCNYTLSLHHVAFENFLHKVNWVGAFWSKNWTFAGNYCSLSVLLSAVGTTRTTLTVLVLVRWWSSEIIRTCVRMLCLLATATIQGWRFIFFSVLYWQHS